MKAGTGAARRGGGTPGAAKPAEETDFRFPLQGGTGLGLLLKLLAQAAQPPAAGSPDPLDTREEPSLSAPEPVSPEPVAPGEIKPTSSGWVLWVSAIILAAFCYLKK